MLPFLPRRSLLHLASKLLLLDSHNVLARHDHQSQVSVEQVHLERRGVRSGGSGGFGSLGGGRLAVLVGVLEDNIAVL